MLVGALSAQGNYTFFLVYGDHFGAGRNHVPNVNRGKELECLPQVDASGTGQIAAQHAREERGDQQAVGNAFTKR